MTFEGSAALAMIRTLNCQLRGQALDITLHLTRNRRTDSDFPGYDNNRCGYCRSKAGSKDRMSLTLKTTGLIAIRL